MLAEKNRYLPKCILNINCILNKNCIQSHCLFYTLFCRLWIWDGWMKTCLALSTLMSGVGNSWSWREPVYNCLKACRYANFCPNGHAHVLLCDVCPSRQDNIEEWERPEREYSLLEMTVQALPTHVLQNQRVHSLALTSGTGSSHLLSCGKIAFS